MDWLKFCQFEKLRISPEFTCFLLEKLTKLGPKIFQFIENSQILLEVLENFLPSLEFLGSQAGAEIEENPAPNGMEIDGIGGFGGVEQNLLRKCLKFLNEASLIDFLLDSLKNVDQDARQMQSMARIAHSLLAVDSMQRNR